MSHKCRSPSIHHSSINHECCSKPPIIHFWPTNDYQIHYYSKKDHKCRSNQFNYSFFSHKCRSIAATVIHFRPTSVAQNFFWPTSVARLNCSKMWIASYQLFKRFCIIHFWPTSVTRHKCRSPQVSLDFLWITLKLCHIKGSLTLNYPQKLFNSLKKWPTSVG